MNIPTSSFWQHANGRTVRMCYLSPVSWEHTMMADIDLHSGDIKEIFSRDENNRLLIAKFNLDVLSGDSTFRRLSLTGNDLSNICEARNIIEKHGNQYAKLQAHVTAILDYDYRYRDASYLLKGEIKKEILATFEAEVNHDAKQAFYCGTTSDLDLKMEYHRQNDFDIAGNRVYAWICASVPTADNIRKWASEEGFDTRCNKMYYLDNRNTTIVYLLKKNDR